MLDFKEYYQERRLKSLGLDSNCMPEDNVSFGGTRVHTATMMGETTTMTMARHRGATSRRSSCSASPQAWRVHPGRPPPASSNEATTKMITRNGGSCASCHFPCKCRRATSIDATTTLLAIVVDNSDSGDNDGNNGMQRRLRRRRWR